MVELSTLPGLFAMAGLAFFSIAALVAVVVPVAAVTVFFRFGFVQGISVTGCTANFAVLPAQLEFGVAIVVEFGLVPLLGAVAVLALDAVATVVDVIQVMA